MLRFVLTVSLVFSGSLAMAANDSDAFFTIDERTLKIQEIDSGVLTQDQVQDLIGDCSELDDNAYPQDLSELINYGKQIWKIVEANKPVVNVTENTANALPRGVQCWTDLEQWNAPKYKTYEVTYENLFGMKVVDFTFQLFFSYGGKVDGKGSYLANVTVAPMQLDVLWGFQMDAVVEVGQVLNTGTKDDPVAGMEMGMKWIAKSPLKESRGQVRFFVQGDGQQEMYD